MSVFSFFRKKPTPTGKPIVRWSPCCFCGLDIAESKTDPCWLTVSPQSKKWQTWFCHAQCFKSLLTKNSEVDLSPAHF